MGPNSRASSVEGLAHITGRDIPLHNPEDFAYVDSPKSMVCSSKAGLQIRRSKDIWDPSFWIMDWENAYTKLDFLAVTSGMLPASAKDTPGVSYRCYFGHTGLSTLMYTRSIMSREHTHCNGLPDRPAVEFVIPYLDLPSDSSTRAVVLPFNLSLLAYLWYDLVLTRHSSRCTSAETDHPQG